MLDLMPTGIKSIVQRSPYSPDDFKSNVVNLVSARCQKTLRKFFENLSLCFRSRLKERFFRTGSR